MARDGKESKKQSAGSGWITVSVASTWYASSSVACEVFVDQVKKESKKKKEIKGKNKTG